MKTEIIPFPGDVPGNSVELRVLRFFGIDTAAPTAYLQSALHGRELPGQAALHFLVPLLQQAETKGQIAGNITIVPQANPIASNQWQAHQHLGRFEFFSLVNFNRMFPLLPDFNTSNLLEIQAPAPLAERLKAELLRLAFPHEIVLDLHCDDESENYLYTHQDFVSDILDLAAALDSTAILAWNTTADAAFEEACAYPILQFPQGCRNMKRRAIATIELGGLSDVSSHKGCANAEGLYRFLAKRGVIRDESVPLIPDFMGYVTPLANVEMLRAPEGGMIFYHVAPGNVVKEGERLVTIVTRPGDMSGDITLVAPQGGYILTRRCQRYTRRGDDLLKLLGSRPSTVIKRSGALEA